MAELIDKTRLIETFEYLIEKSLLLDTAVCFTLSIEAVKEQPIIEAEPVRHCRWLLKPHEHAPAKEFICSECGNVSEHKYYSESGYYSYCKDCGAKMDASPETVENKE